MNPSSLRVLLVGSEDGLGVALGRALGEGFILRTHRVESLEAMTENLSWSDVLLVDLREAKLDPEDERFQFLNALNRIHVHPPLLCYVMRTNTSRL